MLWMSVAALQGPQAGMRQCRRLLSRLCALQEPRLDIRAVTLGTSAEPLHQEAQPAASGIAAGTGIVWAGVEEPSGCSRGQLPLACLEALHERYLQELTCWHPDLVLGTGCSPVERCLFREAAAHDIPAAYCLYAGVPPDYAFPGCQRVLTGPPAFAGFCSELYGINVVAADGCGPDGRTHAVRPEAAAERPSRVLCHEPGTGAALAWLVRLAMMAREQLPELCLELAGSPGAWERQVEGLYDPCSRRLLRASQLDNVEFADSASDDGAAYGRCRMLLAADASPRTVGLALEAAEQGLEVLGPLCRDMFGDAATCLPPPEQVQPWLERLHAALAAAPADVTPGQDWNNPQEERLMAVLAPLLELRAGDDGRSWQGGGPCMGGL